MAENDEIVPKSASLPLKDYVLSKSYHEKIFPSGHIGIYVSDKVGSQLADVIVEFCYEPSETGYKSACELI